MAAGNFVVFHIRRKSEEHTSELQSRPEISYAVGEKAGLSMAAGNFVVFHTRRTIQKSLLHGKELLR